MKFHIDFLTGFCYFLGFSYTVVLFSNVASRVETSVTTFHNPLIVAAIITGLTFVFILYLVFGHREAIL